MKHWKDKTGEIQKYVTYWLSKDKKFQHLNGEGKLAIKILCCFRDENEWDRSEGRAILAMTTKEGARNRDLYGVDFRLTVAHNLWVELSKKQRARLIWHELSHMTIEYDEDGVPLRDNEGRIKLFIEPHDLVVRTFKDEVSQFGLKSDDVSTAKFMGAAYRKIKQ